MSDFTRLLADLRRIAGIIDKPDGWKTKDGEPFTMTPEDTLRTIRALIATGGWLDHPKMPPKDGES